VNYTFPDAYLEGIKMAIATTVSRYLSRQGVEYDILSHPHSSSSGETAQASHVPGALLAKPVLLEDEIGYLMAVVPSNRQVDLGELQRQMNRRLGLATERQIGALFPDCEVGALPPLGPAYGIETVVDNEIAEQPDIFFEAGDHEQLIHVSSETFSSLLGDEVWRGDISH
jgi:Ala-tRNA(Pro) deacylase